MATGYGDGLEGVIGQVKSRLSNKLRERKLFSSGPTAPAFKFHLPFVVPFQKLWDRMRSFWYHLWIPSFPSESIYDIYQGLRSLDDVTTMPIYSTLKINTKVLRAMSRFGSYAVKFSMAASRDFRKYCYHNINTYLDNLAEDVKTQAISKLVRGEKDNKGRDSSIIAGIDAQKGEQAIKKRLPSFTPAELQDILTSSILGAHRSAGEKTFAKIANKMRESYGKDISGIGRGYESKVWVDRLEEFYRTEFDAYIDPAIQLVSYCLPKDFPFQYASHPNEGRKSKAAPKVPLELLAAMGGMPSGE